MGSEWNKPKTPDWAENVPALSIKKLEFVQLNPAVFGPKALPEIRKIIFLDHAPDMKGTSLNISQMKNGPISARLTPDKTTLYIGADGGIDATKICDGLFKGLDLIEQIIFEYNSFHTEFSTGFSNMFRDCKNLKTLNIAVFRTPKAELFSGMFSGCESLTSLTLTNFDTGNVHDFRNMFSGCKHLETLDIRNFKIHTAVKYAKLFDERCNSYLSWAPPGISGMFSGCESLTSLDLRSFRTGRVIDFSGMFENCKNLRKLQLSDGFVIRRDAKTDRMFAGCEKLDKTGLPINLYSVL
ncbi:MAG: BspA family leucine-rich repeat surface protein [Flexilinea sp.]|nr:BspA family leucine-rich repeat surface protein [Flexilinea sp.]